MKFSRVLTLFGLSVFLALPAFGGQQLGPWLEKTLPVPETEPLLTMTVREVSKDPIPAQLTDAVNRVLKQGKDVLLVGFTDQFGPKRINRDLGLKNACDLAYRLGAKGKIDLGRFHCRSAGERAEKVESGISLYAIAPKPPEAPQPPATVSILGPAQNGPITSNLWAMWEKDATTVYWGRSEGNSVSLWRIETTSIPFSMPYPSNSNVSALGVEFGDDQGLVEVEWKPTEPEPLLTMSLGNIENGWATISGRAPEGSTDLVVWCGGIPYPSPMDDGRFYVSVARYGKNPEAYAQVTDPKGTLIRGPVLPLPPNPDGDPKLLVVVTWTGEDVELDLHAWNDHGHTQPEDPDPDMSETAAPGARILFDGDFRSRASALWVDDPTNLEVEAWITELNKEATAFAYIITDPGDPIMRRGLIIGPREISGDPKWMRWAALNTRGRK